MKMDEFSIDLVRTRFHPIYLNGFYGFTNAFPISCRHPFEASRLPLPTRRAKWDSSAVRQAKNVNLLRRIKSNVVGRISVAQSARLIRSEVAV